MNATKIDKKWFSQKLAENQQSMRALAKHMGLDVSAVSRTLSGQRKMQLDEAKEIAHFLRTPVSEVLKHAGVSLDADGAVSSIMLVAAIDAEGNVSPLKDPRPLPTAIVEKAQAAAGIMRNRRTLAAQVRAMDCIYDDAVILFEHTDTVEPAAIGALSITRSTDGKQRIAKVMRARKTGEAMIMLANGEQLEIMLETATPVIAVIP